MRYGSRIGKAVVALAGAALLALIPTTAQAVRTPSPIILTGTLTGTLHGSAGDHAFTFTFVPLEGSAAPITQNVTTDGSDHFSTSVPIGDFHVLVRSVADASTPSWFPGAATHELAQDGAGVLTIGAGATDTVSWTLPVDYGGLTGSWSFGSPTSHSMTVDVYSMSSTGLYPADSLPVAEQTVGNEVPFTFSHLSPGKYAVVFRDTSGLPHALATERAVVLVSSGSTATANVGVAAGGLSFTRLAGADRFATSVAIGAAMFPHPTSVFVVNGLSFPDALSAGPAAARLQAPVLLTEPGSLPSVVAQQLGVWKPAHIYIIGGTPSVSASVATALGAYGAVSRIAGPDRFATSLAVAQDPDFFGAAQRTVYIANGLNFPDALSAGPAASVAGGPVLLVNGGQAGLDAATKNYLRQQNVPIQIAGSSASVSQGIENDIATIQEAQDGSPIDHPRRAGTDRYRTSAQVAAGSFGFPGTQQDVFLATGSNFPDALAGGAAAALDGAPILLVQHDCIPDAVRAQLNRLAPNKIWVLGGTPSIGDLSALPVCGS